MMRSRAAPTGGRPPRAAVIPDNHNHFLMAGGIDLMLAAAAEAGLEEIAFAEHLFHMNEARAAIPVLGAMRPEGQPLDHRTYVETVRAAGERSPLDVVVGIEIDARPDDEAFEAAVAAFR